jgi:hypothetical protein
MIFKRLTTNQRNYKAYAKRCKKAGNSPLSFDAWLHREFDGSKFETLHKGFMQAKKMAGFE